MLIGVGPSMVGERRQSRNTKCLSIHALPAATWTGRFACGKQTNRKRERNKRHVGKRQQKKKGRPKGDVGKGLASDPGTKTCITDDRGVREQAEAETRLDSDMK